MAATLTKTTLVNGTRNFCVHVTIGGTSGDSSDASVVDISAIDSTLSAGDLRLVRASWSLTGCTALLEWNASTDVAILQMDGGHGEWDAGGTAGIQSSTASGADGDITLTTTGYTASGDGGHFTLWFKKK
jgi:hypothetical protein